MTNRSTNKSLTGNMEMAVTINDVLEEGKKSGFITVEAFGEKIARDEYEYLTNHKILHHTTITNKITARAFWDTGDPVGFGLSKPTITEIKNAFGAIYSINFPSRVKNYAPLLPASLNRVEVKIYDDTIDSFDTLRVDELVDQINETLISPSFKNLELKKISFSKELKKVYIGNTHGLNAKYIKTHFNLLLTIGLAGNLIDIAENGTFARQIEPVKLISRADNLLNSLTENPLKWDKKEVPLVFSPEASAFILKEFADYFKIRGDKKLMELSFPSILNIIDDPLLDGKACSVPFDDEGMQTAEKYLVRKGSLHRFISDIQTAFKYGKRSSGNGFRNDRSLFPGVRFTNLYIKPTVLSLKNLMEDAGEGVLVSLLKLKSVDKQDCVFSAYGYKFSGHCLMEPVHFYFSTTFFNYFLHILKISKEIKFFYSTYNIGSPYVLLEAKQKSPGTLTI
ncbi:MAG: metallopeptidase TldD-related protein [Acidobacteria bacterium]|jgi:predicted Zn-dependent protease|nr:metallopeptidase TldD-related protein [Acidobacteriota bacterium]